MRHRDRRLLGLWFVGVVSLSLVSCSPTTRQPDFAGTVCNEARDRLQDPGNVVVVNIENDPALPDFVEAFAYAPGAITVRVGQVIEFVNRDPDVQHTAELDNGACGTDYLDYNAADALVFDVPGTYRYHCLVHGTALSGTITIVRQ